ncbi:MAG: enoyl-CoA hydratase/isomerase family protein [Actinomycetota bacterium]
MPLVNVERDGAIVTLTLDRPEARNALSVDMCDAIVAALGAIEDDARVVIVRGEGKAFCAGADFGELAGGGGVTFVAPFTEMLETVAHFRLPVIGQIHGACVGGGLQLASSCDFRIATEDAKIGIPSARLGILVNFESVERIVLLAGVAIAKQIFMTARTFTGTEAAAVGLVDQAVPAPAVPGAVDDLARTIASLAPLSVQGVKRSIQVVADQMGGARRADPDAVAEIDALVAQAYASDDLAEGLTAMSEKRPPNFRGR